MKIPSNEADKLEFLKYVIDACMVSQQDRVTLYDRRRRYFLFGQDATLKVKFNRLKSHMKLVSSFLFSQDGLVYNIAPPKNADKDTIQKMLALADDWNEDVHDSGLGDVFSEAVLWALNFDTMVIKMGWNDTKNHVFGKLVNPADFGVWREDDPDFESQPAMNHSFTLDYDEACTRLARAGKADMIPTLQLTDMPAESGLPAPLTNIIISAVNGTGVQESIMGSANPDYEATPLFRARLSPPMVRFNETWIWDNDTNDYRIFHSLDGGVIISDSLETISAIKKADPSKVKYNSESNWFMEKTNPFVPVTPFPLYDYFWGDAHMEDIIPLQNWSEQRLTEINETLEAQVDPLRTAHGMMGLTDEKTDLDYGAYIADDNPASKLEEHRPPMPEDLFREFNEIGGLMMEASGLTEVVSGKSSGGARGGQQQKQMQITGGGQIRKVAIGLEAALVRMGDIGIRLKMKNDDGEIALPSGTDFLASQVPDDFSLRVDGHSQSPLFTLESRELAQTLFKAQAIDRSWLIRLLNPTQKQNLLHSLREREEAEAKAAQQKALMGQAEPKKGKK